MDKYSGYLILCAMGDARGVDLLSQMDATRSICKVVSVRYFNLPGPCLILIIFKKYFIVLIIF